MTAEPPFLSDSPTGNTALPCQSLDRLWIELKELSNVVGCKDVMRVMDFSGARASAWNFSACGSNKLREYVEPVHLFDHLESAGISPQREDVGIRLVGYSSVSHIGFMHRWCQGITRRTRRM